MTNTELNKMTVAELKNMIKEQCSKLGKELPAGLWKMPKDSIIKEIELNLQMLNEENANEVKEVKITKLESKMLLTIPQSNFFNDNITEDGLKNLAIWTDNFLDEDWKDPKQGRGVLGSLVKKGMINVSSGEDSVITLNEAGIKFILENQDMKFEE